MSTFGEDLVRQLDTGIVSTDAARKVVDDRSAQLDAGEAGDILAAIARSEMAAEAKKRAQRKKGVMDVLPPGWFREYLLFCQASESPDSFHLFSAMAFLTHIVGRRMWWPMGPMRPIYPPLSIILVSPAAAGRRSTGADVALRICKHAGASVIQDVATPEGLLMSLNENNRLLFFADEASMMLNQMEYMATMPQLLCTLMTCPDLFEKRLKKGKDSISVKDVTFNTILTTAPNWLKDSMPKSALEGGLFSRSLMIYETEAPREIALPHRTVSTKVAMAAAETLSRRLVEITGKQIEGECDIDKEATALHAKFYSETKRDARAADERVAPYFSRKNDHLMRICMALMVSGEKNDRIIDIEILETAMALLALIEQGMKRIYKVSGLERPGQNIERVMTILRRAAKEGRMEVSRTKLVNATSGTMHAADLDKALAVLIETGQVRCGAPEVRKGRSSLTYMVGEEWEA